MAFHVTPELIFGQDKQEFYSFLSLVTSEGCRSALEIGSRFGETARLIALSMPVGSRIICLDYGINPPIPSEVDFLSSCRGRLATLTGYETRLIVADSHDPQTQAEVSQYAPFDLCFIDGDHSYEGVKLDWKMYGRMARIVAFHDILRERDYGPWKLWSELKQNYPHVELTHSRGNRNLGIGVLWR